MLSFLQQANPKANSLCDGLQRREWLRLGGLGLGGLSLAQWDALRLQATETRTPQPEGKAKSCIVLFMLGGPPQHETWDPKPDAPREIRGDLLSIPSATPGLRVGELMPLTARWTERIAVLRAMATDDNAHSSSGYWMLTGRPHSPKNSENALPGAPNNAPSLPALIRHLQGDRAAIPAAMRLPEEIWNTGRIVWPGQDAGWLGNHADPWLLTCDPNQPTPAGAGMGLGLTASVERLSERRDLLEHLLRSHESAFPSTSPAATKWDGLKSKAMEMLASSTTREAFALDQETNATRDRYGRNRFGQSVLLARRLIEANVALVQVNWTRWLTDPDVAPAWDTHADNTKRLKESLMPIMDQAYSALLEDLEQRGLLDETLVVWAGEFGRSPKINPVAGRDHWGHCFSAALAGGGIRGGIVHGQSDRHGGYPLEGRVEPQDLIATIFASLGLDPHTELHDALGRPYLACTGKPISSILT